ncbi:uncharacterized protein [Venturia canescens]|uniref:uncharacterized protein isoform X2 n=1 Tax=Venturia canescens TaxID=32260 RepID=UPI001C9C46ED|nr:uncharacterized protein LOC122413526 isoform X2 [Venturia canescens]XP_043279873.1 uncharacterized protein LOC122413526 isoform X2 [Venturia canescens]
MDAGRYVVIEFHDGVTLAPEKWLTPRKNHCYWPPYKSNSRTTKAVENQENVAENWTLHDIKQILTSTKTYKRGQAKCVEALQMSDINTDTDVEKITTQKGQKPQSSINISPFPSFPSDEQIQPTDHDSNTNANAHDDINEVSENMMGPRRTDAVTNSTKRKRARDENLFDEPIREKRPLNSIPNSSYRNDNSNQTIMRALANMDLRIETILAEVRDIARTLSANTADKEIEKTESPLLKDYPVATEALLTKAEHRLSTDPDYLNNLIKDLAIFVQADVKSTVSKLMQEIMSNSVAANFSFHGAHKKKAFAKLKLYNVLSRVVRFRFKNPVVTNKDINDPIKSWLRHAPARLAREHKKDAASNNDGGPLEIDDAGAETNDNTD